MTNKLESKIAEMAGSMICDPYRFVQAMYPWGSEYTAAGEANALRDGIVEDWQKRLLIRLGEHIIANEKRRARGEETIPWRSAIVSGHGVGKSALVAWLIYFLMSTRKNTRGVVTASTQFQLEDKTWPELSKWHRLALNSHWFNWSATRFWYRLGGKEVQKNYMVTAATVAEHNTEAFAGLHNHGNTVFVIFDEASGIYRKIWEVAEGALTDGEAFFFAFGNGTQPDGEFYDCFHKHAHLYYTDRVDSRDVSFSNKSAIRILLEKFGKDSDEARVRVYGEFPAQSFSGFIGKAWVDSAMNRDSVPDPGAALIMGIDVARKGNSETVMGFRQGKDNRSFPLRRYRGLDNVDVADRAAELINEVQPDAVVIEAPGPGGGVIDILRRRGYLIEELYPGANARDKTRFANRRAEMWSEFRDWLSAGGSLPKDRELARQLLGMEYSYNKRDGRLLMESKVLRKEKKKPSPDWADMIVLTFGVTVPRRDQRNSYWHTRTLQGERALLDDDPFSRDEVRGNPFDLESFVLRG